jgi:hypothetical protein
VHAVALALRDADLVDRRAVDDGVAVLAGVADDARGVQVALDQLGAEPLELRALLARPDERDHIVAALAQPAHDLAADESRSPGDEDLHGAGL